MEMEGECSSPGIVSESGKPVRVIDVAATVRSVGGVCFKEPDAATDFHIISHTWSQEVRDFSQLIGLLSQNSGTSTSPGLASVYNDAFQNANFSESDCYKHLKVFLKMLEDDGVEYVWFDALCIDQTNATEKGVEIARMAGYYSNNKGCYVLTHGIGKGYKFRKIKEVRLPYFRCVLPRWFERAWTLQEYLLPTKLTFLVEFNWKEATFINAFIKFKECAVGLCKCCIYDESGFAKQYREKHRIDNVVELEDPPELICKRDEMCKKCRSFPLLRKAANKMVYFVDRDAYTPLSGLLRIAGLSYGAHVAPLHWQEQNIVQLLTLLLRRQSPMIVAHHIAKRNCSNKEDRILCILGLLGSNDVEPVRTGLQLDEQIFRVCENNHDLLIQLCAMSIKGNCKPGMSWAPWLISDSENDDLVSSATGFRFCPGRITKRDVEVVNVCTKGIELRAHITRNLVSGIPGRLFYSGVRTFLPDSVFNFNMFSFRTHGLCINRPLWGYLGMPLCNYSNLSKVEFEMWWILLGDTQYKAKDCKVVMACIGKDVDDLHKIGLFWIPFKRVSRIFPTLASPRSPCFVGGFGEYLDEYVTPSSKEEGG